MKPIHRLCLLAALALVLQTLALIASPALAQQPTPQPLDQRIASQIGQLVIQDISQGVQIEQLQAALTAAQMEVKALKDKYEPKAAEPKQ
jgi:hypothetical protein